MPRPTRGLLRTSLHTGLSPSMVLTFPGQVLVGSQSHWPGPRSLAATSGVSVDVLSSGYLDVSVRRVCLLQLWIHYRIRPKPWVSPFGNSRVNGCSPLTWTYRSVPRPSSPLSAKAFTKCPSHKNSTTPSPKHARHAPSTCLTLAHQACLRARDDCISLDF